MTAISDQAKQTWIESERMRQAAQSNPHITPDNYDRGSVRGNGVFEIGQDFGSASVGDTYLDDIQQVPTYSPIEWEDYAAQEDIEEVKGVTAAYRDTVNKINALGAQAAGMGINIAAINPNDENQVYLNDQYRELLASADKMGNYLKVGYDATEAGSKAGMGNQNRNVNAEGESTTMTINGVEFDKASDMQGVYDAKRYDSSMTAANQKGQKIDDPNMYVKLMAEHKQSVDGFNEDAKIAEENGNYEQARILREKATSLVPPVTTLKKEEIDLAKKEYELKKKASKEAQRYASLEIEKLVKQGNEAELVKVSVKDADGGIRHKGEVWSTGYNDQAFGDGRYISGVQLDPKTNRVIGVRTYTVKDGKKVYDEETSPNGSDLSFLGAIIHNGNYTGKQKEMFDNGIALIQEDTNGGLFDAQNNIVSTGDGRNFEDEIQELSENFITTTDATGLKVELSRSLSDMLGGDDVLTGAIQDSLKGLSKSNPISKDGLAKMITVNKDIADPSKYKSYYLIPHHNNGRFAIVAQTHNGAFEVPSYKMGGASQGKKIAEGGITQEHLKGFLGTEGSADIDKWVNVANEKFEINEQGKRVLKFIPKKWDMSSVVTNKAYGETNNNNNNNNESPVPVPNWEVIKGGTSK